MITNYQINTNIFKESLLKELREKSVNSEFEICGFVFNGWFLEKSNVHPDKKNFFVISSKDCIWDKSAVLFHSHPKHIHRKGFSEWDIENQYYFNLDTLLYSVNNDEFYFRKS